MRTLPRCLIPCVAIAAIASAASCDAQKDAKGQQAPRVGGAATRPHDGGETGGDTEFARFVELGDDEGSFEVSLTTYKNRAGQEVTLIASIHIADGSHYEWLQKEFRNYDAMLYELVARKGDRPKPGMERSGSGGPVGLIQKGMKNALGLSFQLDHIDYTPQNFVHADLTPRGFEKLMDERGESLLSIMMDMMVRQGRAQAEADADENAPPPKKFDIVSAFRSNEGRHTLRMMAARVLVNVESLAAGVDEDGKGSALLEGRNDRCLEVLDEQLGVGKKKLAIYYGAAHMPDIAKKLKRDHGFKLVNQRWVEAWDVRKRPDSQPQKPETGAASRPR